MTPVPSYPPLGCVSPSVVGLAFLPKIGKLHFHAPTYFHLTAVSGRDVGLEHDNVGEVHVAELGHKSAASSINLKTIYNGRVYGSNAIFNNITITFVLIILGLTNIAQMVGMIDRKNQSKL